MSAILMNELIIPIMLMNGVALNYASNSSSDPGIFLLSRKEKFSGDGALKYIKMSYP